MHRRSMYFKKRQADFDPLSRFVHRTISLWLKNRVKTNNAKKSFGVKLTEVANAFTGAFAPKVNAYALA